MKTGGESSLRKCIRPLASGLGLQPGHDEICAHCSQIASSGMAPAFGRTAYNASINSLVISLRASQSAD